MKLTEEEQTFSRGHERVQDVLTCLMCVTMSVSLLLLLVLSVCDRALGADKQEAVNSPDDHGTRLRGLWKLHMKETLLKGKGQKTVMYYLVCPSFDRSSPDLFKDVHLQCFLCFTLSKTHLY